MLAGWNFRGVAAQHLHAFNGRPTHFEPTAEEFATFERDKRAVMAINVAIERQETRPLTRADMQAQLAAILQQEHEAMCRSQPRRSLTQPGQRRSSLTGEDGQNLLIEIRCLHGRLTTGARRLPWRPSSARPTPRWRKFSRRDFSTFVARVTRTTVLWRSHPETSGYCRFLLAERQVMRFDRVVQVVADRWRVAKTLSRHLAAFRVMGTLEFRCLQAARAAAVGEKGRTRGTTSPALAENERLAPRCFCKLGKVNS